MGAADRQRFAPGDILTGDRSPKAIGGPQKLFSIDRATCLAVAFFATPRPGKWLSRRGHFGWSAAAILEGECAARSDIRDFMDMPSLRQRLDNPVR